MLDNLIKRIKVKTGDTQESIATKIKYSRAHFSVMKKENPEQLFKLIMDEYSNIIEQESDSSYQQRRLRVKIDGKQDDNTAPFVPVKAQAGYSHAYDQSEYIDSFERYALPPNITKHGAIWRYWEIAGESMLPTFKHKDVILTSQVHEMDWDQLRNFYCYVIVTDEHVLFKRIAQVDGRWIAISDNEDNGYEQFEIDPRTVKEVWVFRRHIDSSAPVPKEFKIKI